jgi:hypothetical protein
MNWKILGLNKYESAVYDAIIKLGKGNAAQILKVSSIPHGRIYDTIDSLIAKGMVQLFPGKPKTYSITNPKIIEHAVAEKENELAKIKVDLKKMKKIYEEKPEEPVLVVTGQKAWYKMIGDLKMQDPGKFSYKINYAMEYNPLWVRKEKEELSKKVDAKVLTRYDDETKERVRKWLKINKNMKTYPNQGVSFWTTNNFLVIALIKSNTTVLIRDKACIEMMKKLFEDAYKNAEQISN